MKADEAYIRESILQPQAKIVAGYQPVMPTFQGLVTEEDVLQLVEYIKSLGAETGKPARWNAGSSRAAAIRGTHSGQSLEPYDYRSGTRTRDIT